MKGGNYKQCDYHFDKHKHSHQQPSNQVLSPSNKGLKDSPTFLKQDPSKHSQKEAKFQTPN